MMAADTEGNTEIGKRRFAQDGFTLIELLVVIIILGILAAVAVFSVGGIGNTGEDSACKVDTRTLETAQAAAFAKAREETGTGEYLSETELVNDDFLSDRSPLHDIDLPAPVGESYTITLSDRGLEQCVPESVNSIDVENAECDLRDPPVTPIATVREVKVCSLDGNEDDRYPY